MMRLRQHTAAALFFALVAAQVIGLTVFAAVQEAKLRGTEVTLQTVPVDPRSLLQGDYAILDYEIAELPPHLADLPPGSIVYVTLAESAGAWPAVAYQPDQPPPDDGATYIRGEVNARRRLDFGIGAYFVPEGAGPHHRNGIGCQSSGIPGPPGQSRHQRAAGERRPIRPLTPLPAPEMCYNIRASAARLRCANALSGPACPPAERCQSGRMGATGNRVGVNRLSRVRIPPSPPSNPHCRRPRTSRAAENTNTAASVSKLTPPFSATGERVCGNS